MIEGGSSTSCSSASMAGGCVLVRFPAMACSLRPFISNAIITSRLRTGLFLSVFIAAEYTMVASDGCPATFCRRIATRARFLSRSENLSSLFLIVSIPSWLFSSTLAWHIASPPSVPLSVILSPNTLFERPSPKYSEQSSTCSPLSVGTNLTRTSSPVVQS